MPPRIIRVPPPKVAVVPFLTLPYMLWLGFLVLGGLFTAPAWTKPLWCGGFLMAAVVGLVGECRHRVRLNRRRREWLERHPIWDANRVAERLDRLWFFLSSPPRPDAIRESIRWAGLPPREATVVCLGALDVPEIGDYRFEPHVLSPGAVARRAESRVALLVFLLTWNVLLWIEMLGHLPKGLSGVYLIPAFVVAAVVWLGWRYAFRPMYLRVAPGVIEVLTYSLGRSAPRIRRYTVAPDLLCIVSQGWARVSVTLVNSQNRDEFQVTARRSEQLLDTLLRALVSTAPTPPLSNEELVG